ncbi:hypothetical protein [Streptomyces mirabilis]|uniref:hypothetical protein n=1 Tax=Streptomyces mirabilis TaxID=68239 RepID=UPI0036B903A6
MTAPLVADEQVDVAHVAEIVGTRLEDGDWYIGVFLTDLPSRMERNPVSTEFEREHRVALISLPALGYRRLRRRVRQAVVGVDRQQAAQDEEPLVRRRRRACRWTRCVPCHVQRVETRPAVGDGRPSPTGPAEEWAILVRRHPWPGR